MSISTRPVFLTGVLDETSLYRIDAFDLKLLEESVKSLLSGNSVTIPVWDAVNHTRCVESY